ncbi:MAG: DUF4340 domain-containing protein [Planctomycetota bacterium]
MNEFAKTGAVLGVAAALTALALFTGPREARLDLFDDQGEVFFAKLTDGDAVAELVVTAFREEQSDVFPFAVKRDSKGVWTIPSHYNYPADAKDQMGKAAAMLIGLTKQSVVGDERSRHAEFGVVDPLAEGVETKGRGKRVTMKDSGGNVLADLIVGNEVKGKPSTYYVCVPGKDRVYTAKLDGKLSTKFADWIETDLLKAQSWNIDSVIFDNYSIDEQAGQIVKGEKFVLKKDAASKWVLDGLDAATEETNEDKARDVTTTLGQIKIVGVLPKPEGLTARLERANGIEAAMLSQSLQAKGFFLGRGGKLWSNEGDLLFETKSGVRYTLRFGELARDDGSEVSGIGSEPKEGEQPAEEAKNRYLMVSAEFAEELLQKPTGPRLEQAELDKRGEARKQVEAIQKAVEAFRAGHENQLPVNLLALTEKPAEGEALLAELLPDPWGGEYQLTAEGDGYVVSSFGADKAAGGDGGNADVRSDRLPFEDELQKFAGEWTTFDAKVKTGQEEADKLTARFGPWYYVIDKTLFDKLKPKRADLVKPKAADDAANPGDGK